MDQTHKSDSQDRWWIVAIAVAIAGTGLVWLLWKNPTSELVWALASIFLVFAVVMYFNPRHRRWRSACACFGVAGSLAFVPTFKVNVVIVKLGVLDFASEASPLLVLGFLATGVFLAWLDAGPRSSAVAASGVSARNDLSIVNSPQSFSGLTAGNDIIINCGVTEETLQAALENQRALIQAMAVSRDGQQFFDEDLLWRLVDQIKEARRKLEREETAKLVIILKARFKTSGASWPYLLRTEALVLLAEQESARISQAMADGEECDRTEFQELLKELHNG